MQYVLRVFTKTKFKTSDSSIRSYPWQKFGADLFNYKGTQCLLLSDYYIKFPIIRKLTLLKASARIQHVVGTWYSTDTRNRQ